MRTPAKGGVLVYDVKYLSNFLHSNRSNRLVIPLIEAVLLSTIPLIDQTRISMIDILDGLADEHPIEILAVFENLIRSDWFDRCSRAKFEQILIEKCLWKRHWTKWTSQESGARHNNQYRR